ncbi:MAG: hypothetical protein Q9172_005731 [Xanthocarpia lactea]
MSKEHHLLQANRLNEQERKHTWFEAAINGLPVIGSNAKSTDLPSPSRCWKPITLQAPLLLGVAGVTFSSTAILIYLSWKSRNDGGLAFARPDEDFSLIVVFASFYLPTLLAVTLGMFWSWVDLDTKRLEPYFQLSKPHGASAADSIHLHYPFDFVAIAPIRAFKRRHWSVFLSGTTTTVIFWLITPLLGAVFTENRVTRSLDSTAATVADLVSSTTSGTRLDAGIMTDAYGITWLGQDFPDFVTADGAVAPFELKSGDRSRDSGMTWTATTNLYTTELICTPAKIGGNPETGHTFDNGRGCRTDPIAIPSGSDKYCAFYIGYFNDPRIAWSLVYLGCPRSASHSFLAIWAASENSTYTNITALFCEPTYAVQRVEATVMAANNTLVKSVPVGPPVALSNDLFNTTDFEYLIGVGAPAQSPRAEVTRTEVIDQWPRIKDLNVKWPVGGNMVGFALGASQRSPDDYFDSTVLASSFQAAHQLLFGLAIRRLVSNATVTPGLRHGLATSEVKAIVVVSVLPVVVEVFFGLVTLFILTLLALSSTRKIQLRADPASIAEIIDLIKPSGTRTSNVSTAMDLCQGTHPIKLRDGKLSTSPANLANASTPLATVTKSFQTSARPLEMTMKLGTLFLMILCGAVIVLVAVYVQISRANGLPLPSTNQTVKQLVLNYIPIMFATLLEPFWILLNRMLCILQPFEEIRQGRAKPSQSLDVKYTSLPPQLIFWRALRARHLLLVAVCLIGFSANFLAVALGALFEENWVQTESPTRYFSATASTINQTALDRVTQGSPNPYEEPLFVAQSNMTSGTKLPPWITPHLFFTPFDTKATPRQKDTLLYRGSTHGIGLQVQCLQLNSSASNTKVFHDRTYQDFFVLKTQTATLPNANETPQLEGITCMTEGFNDALSGSVNGTQAAEIFAAMTPFSQNASKEEQDFCSRQLIAAFFRANVTVVDTPPETSDSRASDFRAPGYQLSEALYVGCELSIQMASFDVAVDHEGYVQEYSQKTPLSEAAFPLPQLGNISSLHNGINTAMWSKTSSGSQETFWHTDLVADSWLKYLIKSRMQSTAFLDPSLPPPSASAIGPVLEDISARLFAIVLGINTDIFLPAAAGSTIPGVTIIQVKRVFMSRPMFVVSIVLIALNLIMAVLYYAKRPPKMLEEMPTTIASILKLVEGSGLAMETADAKIRAEWQIGYGRYVGTDGKPHIGIERKPFVVPWSGR